MTIYNSNFLEYAIGTNNDEISNYMYMYYMYEYTDGQHVFVKRIMKYIKREKFKILKRKKS